MTDTDLDIDPALDAHLRRTFREVAASVIDAATDGNVIRLVTASAPTPRSHRWAWLGAAAAAGVVAGAGLMTLADRDNGHVDVPVASTAPVVEPDLEELGRACADNIAGQRAQFPVELRDYGPSLPEPDGATVLLFDARAEQTPQVLLVIGESSFIVCQVDHRSPLQADPNVYRLPVLGPEDDGVLVVDRTSSTGTDPTHGPGWVRLIGRSGSDVVDVELEWTDGTIVPGHVQHGWFFIEGAIPPGVPDSDERLHWTVTNGDQHSGRADLLDAPHEVEACATSPGCVENRLSELLLQAERTGSDDQAAVLADMDVTTAERDAALQRFADCVNATPFDFTVTVVGDGVLEFGGPAMTRGSPEWTAQNNAQILCGAAHLDLVEEAHALLDAQRRVAEG